MFKRRRGVLAAVLALLFCASGIVIVLNTYRTLDQAAIIIAPVPVGPPLRERHCNMAYCSSRFFSFLSSAWYLSGCLSLELNDYGEKGADLPTWSK